MTAAAAVWDAIAGFLKAVNAILSVVPGLVWAAALAAALLHTWSVTGDRDAAVKGMNEAKGALTQLQGAVKAQKQEAATLLAKRTAERDDAQHLLDERHRAQEHKDANNQAIIDRQAARLRLLSRDAGGRGLSDPNATAGCGCRRGSTEGAAPALAGKGPDDAGQTGGLLSIQLERLLFRLTGEADTINAAYESCRVDAMSVRGIPPAAPLVPAD